MANEELIEKIQPEIIAGEKLLWVGKPDPWRFLIKGKSLKTLVPIVASVVFVICLDVYYYYTYTVREPIYKDYSALAMSGFLTFLLIVIAAGLLWTYLSAFSVVYALTTRRAIIMQDNTIDSYGKKDIEVVRRKVVNNGKGDIVFAYHYVKRTRSRGYSSRPYTKKVPVGFFGIEDVRKVEALMRKVFDF